MQAARRQVVVDSLWVHQHKLHLRFHVEGLLDDKAIQGLERGFTSEVNHLVQLWQVKGVLSQVVETRPVIIRIYHDNGSQKFAIVTETESRLTSQIETLRQMSTTVPELVVADASRLEADARFFVTISTLFQPISDETYGELRAWVSGRSRSNGGHSVKRGRFFGFLFDLLGFGDRALQVRTGTFYLDRSGSLHYLE